MEIVKLHLPKRVNNPGTAITPRGIILHYIGNPGTTARQNASYFAHVETQTSVHYIVDETEIVELIPPDRKSYGTSDRAHNESCVQIEMCHPDGSGRIEEAVLEKVVWLCRELMGRYGITEILRHYDVTGKRCPLWYVTHPEEWEALKERITKGEDEMTEELRETLAALEGRLAAVEAETVNRMIYNYVDGNMPEWARGTVQKLMDRGYLKGTDEGLGLDDAMLRMLVMLDRAGAFGE